MKYRKKPLVIDAFRWMHNQPPKWFLQAIASDRVILHTDDTPIEIRTPAGVLKANPGDWIVRGLKGEELYPVKPEIFEASYEVTIE